MGSQTPECLEAAAAGYLPGCCAALPRPANPDRLQNRHRINVGSLYLFVLAGRGKGRAQKKRWASMETTLAEMNVALAASEAWLAALEASIAAIKAVLAGMVGVLAAIMGALAARLLTWGLSGWLCLHASLAVPGTLAVPPHFRPTASQDLACRGKRRGCMQLLLNLEYPKLSALRAMPCCTTWATWVQI